MRALFDTRPATNETGIGRYTRTLRDLLRDLRPDGLPRGHEVVFLDELISSWGSPAEEELELPALLEREGIDVFHSPLFLLPAALPPGTRAVVTLHDAIPAVRPELCSPVFRELFERRARDAAEQADLIVCPSEHAREELQAALGLSAGKLRVLPEAPAACFGPQDQVALDATLTRHDLRSGEFLLAVGTRERRKGPDLLLEALASPATGQVVLAWAGREGDVDLSAEAARLGLGARVRVLGLVPDLELAALMAASLAVVVASRHEGFGLPVLEAFACAAPVVAAQATSLPEVAGNAALLVPPEDPGALAAAIGRLREDETLREDLRRRGRARLDACYSPAAVQAGLRSLYEGLVAS